MTAVLPWVFLWFSQQEPPFSYGVPMVFLGNDLANGMVMGSGWMFQQNSEELTEFPMEHHHFQ